MIYGGGISSGMKIFHPAFLLVGMEMIRGMGGNEGGRGIWNDATED